jgi:hypothetical protein
LTNAPDIVDEKQLAELSIALALPQKDDAETENADKEEA